MEERIRGLNVKESLKLTFEEIPCGTLSSGAFYVPAGDRYMIKYVGLPDSLARSTETPVKRGIRPMHHNFRQYM